MLLSLTAEDRTTDDSLKPMKLAQIATTLGARLEMAARFNQRRRYQETGPGQLTFVANPNTQGRPDYELPR